MPARFAPPYMRRRHAEPATRPSRSFALPAWPKRRQELWMAVMISMPHYAIERAIAPMPISYATHQPMRDGAPCPRQMILRFRWPLLAIILPMALDDAGRLRAPCAKVHIEAMACWLLRDRLSDYAFVTGKRHSHLRIAKRAGRDAGRATRRAKEGRIRHDFASRRAICRRHTPTMLLLRAPAS